LKLDRPTLDTSSGELSPQQLAERGNRVYSHFVLRGLGRWGLPWAVKLGVTPNQVTAGAILVTAAGLILLAAGGTAFAIAGILTVHLGLVMDNLDGDLARLTGRTSPRGEFLDALMGYLYGAFVLPAVGFAITRAPDLGYDMMSSVVDFQPDVFVTLGVSAGFLFLAARLVSLRYIHIFGQSVGEGSAKIRRVGLNIFDLLPLLLAVGAATGLMSLVLVAFALFHLSGLVYMTLTSFTRAGSDLKR
jgi:hypothetical protein